MRAQVAQELAREAEERRVQAEQRRRQQAAAEETAAREAKRRLLHEVAAAGDCARIRSLITAGMNVNAVERETTPLCAAVGGSHLDAARLLLDLGANVNLCAPLSVAANHWDSRMIRMLLERGADVNQGIEKGRTPLEAATSPAMDWELLKCHRDKYVEIVKLLLDSGANVNGSSGRFSNDYSLRKEHAPIIKAMWGVVRAADWDPDSLGHAEAVVRLLIASGANRRDAIRWAEDYMKSEFERSGQFVELLNHRALEACKALIQLVQSTPRSAAARGGVTPTTTARLQMGESRKHLGPSTCKDCGREIRIGDYPFCPHQSMKSEALGTSSSSGSWIIDGGPVVLQEAANLGIVRFGSADVVRLQRPPEEKADVVVISGKLGCPDCGSELPLDQRVELGLGGGGELSCSCGSRFLVGQSCKSAGSAVTVYIYASSILTKRPFKLPILTVSRVVPA